MKQYYTPEQFVLKAVGKYPTLYSDRTYNEVRFRVLDHVFNTIGNGIDLRDFVFQDYDFDGARKYTTGENLYYGYHKDDCIVKEFGNGVIWIDHKSGAKPIDVLESEKDNHPEIGDFMLCTQHKKNPYPNFNKTYSLVYDKEFKFKILGSEWINEAIWYYQQALKYFESDNSRSYHYAFPHYDDYHNRDDSQWKLEDFQNHIKGKYESHEALSEAYGVDGYDGDDYAFLSRRWNQERARIITFINDTIKMLEELN